MKRFLADLRERLWHAVFPLNGFRGMFRNTEEARRWIPRRWAAGYDQAAAKTMYKTRLHRVDHDDYPAMFWLKDALRPGCRIFEIGGHVGLAFYGFERCMPFPPGLRWTIMDTPAVTEAGRALAAQAGRSELSFVEDMRAGGGSDVVLASGSLQYIESPSLPEVLASWNPRPRHVILNKTPVWDGPTFVTIQNIDISLCPYIIRNAVELATSMEALGFKLVDCWAKEREFHIPFKPAVSAVRYRGFYFRRAEDEPAVDADKPGADSPRAPRKARVIS
jgi:putative methyltransferase (TIGR04325 family)